MPSVVIYADWAEASGWSATATSDVLQHCKMTGTDQTSAETTGPLKVDYRGYTGSEQLKGWTLDSHASPINVRQGKGKLA